MADVVRVELRLDVVRRPLERRHHGDHAVGERVDVRDAGVRAAPERFLRVAASARTTTSMPGPIFLISSTSDWNFDGMQPARTNASGCPFVSDVRVVAPMPVGVEQVTTTVGGFTDWRHQLGSKAVTHIYSL